MGYWSLKVVLRAPEALNKLGVEVMSTSIGLLVLRVTREGSFINCSSSLAIRNSCNLVVC